ncbi:hypothetical protein ORD22_01700 [Sporosarcina sp. GW1-11]|uniref:flagellin N-terminal helical domain-containing protein n=1 Tax=Sporosarcina sp. GW1-11 TaxID=2899126 RepID=UPI00294EF1B2|nr:hypothetical protein [Sporosarcina sp. GW1-11]MDV6376977.1 hypothetical protein [Sporosarcina sp. GW1-11]
MIIKNGSLGLQRNMNQANDRLEKSMAKLSSGKWITSAAVDASGLAISEKLRALQRGSRRAHQNGQDAQSLIILSKLTCIHMSISRKIKQD